MYIGFSTIIVMICKQIKVLCCFVGVGMLLFAWSGCSKKETEDVSSDFFYDALFGVIDFPDKQKLLDYFASINDIGFKEIDGFKQANGISEHPLEARIEEVDEIDTTEQDTEKYPDLEVVRILNQSGVVGIGKYYFRFNFDNRKIFRLDKARKDLYFDLLTEDTASGQVQVYSFDDELIGSDQADIVGDCTIPALKDTVATAQRFHTVPDVKDSIRYKAKVRFTRYGVIAIGKVKVVLNRKLGKSLDYGVRSDYNVKVSGVVSERCGEFVDIRATTGFKDVRGLKKYLIFTGEKFPARVQVNVEVADTRYNIDKAVSLNLNY
jgi:hypothetical protein